MSVLVIGAAPGSVGWYVTNTIIVNGGTAITAGIGQETNYLDAAMDHEQTVLQKLALLDPTHIVCTAGVNLPLYAEDPFDWYRTHFDNNVIGPMRLLNSWQQLLGQQNDENRGARHFVAISSNSARVPRSGSAAYCASKAALSMALRVKAREVSADPNSRLIVYGYEPGLLSGTPMTRETVERFAGVPLTRMRPYDLRHGISTPEFSKYVVEGLKNGAAMNGMLIPFDADEA